MQRISRFVLAVVLAGLVAVGGLVWCASLQGQEQRPAKWRPPRIVRLGDTKGCLNYSFPTWIAGAREDRPAALLVREGDILMFEGQDDEGLVFPYLESDGTSVSFEFDEFGALLGGKRVSLSEETDAWEWIERATPQELADLRFFGYELSEAEYESSRLHALRKLAGANPNIGWMIEEREILRQVLPLFDPRCLMLGEDGVGLEASDAELISNEPMLEFMWIIPEGLKSLEFLARLKRLRSLTLVDWDQEETGPFPAGCEGLRAVTIFGAGLEDLSPIASLRGLDELHLVVCEELSDLSALSGFSSLKALTLSGCGEVTDLSVLQELKDLEWLGLPPGVSQAAFEGVVADHPDLRVLELFECDEISDLGALRRLDKLESLVLLGPSASLDPLHELKSLRLLVLPEEAFEEPADEVRRLEEALPGCLVVAGDPFCLGSGWILMLFPAVGLAWLLSAKSRKKRARLFSKNV